MQERKTIWLDPRMMRSQERALGDLGDLLSGLGIDLEVGTVESNTGSDPFVSLDFKYDAEGLRTMRTRNAGRHRKEPGSGSPLDGLDAAAALEWLDAHTVAEGMEALGGVSRTVYYRRKRSLKRMDESKS